MEKLNLNPKEQEELLFKLSMAYHMLEDCSKYLEKLGIDLVFASLRVPTPDGIGNSYVVGHPGYPDEQLLSNIYAVASQALMHIKRSRALQSIANEKDCDCDVCKKNRIEVKPEQKVQ